jgi:hypothetical protein
LQKTNAMDDVVVVLVVVNGAKRDLFLSVSMSLTKCRFVCMDICVEATLYRNASFLRSLTFTVCQIHIFFGTRRHFGRRLHKQGYFKV